MYLYVHVPYFFLLQYVVNVFMPISMPEFIYNDLLRLAWLL